MTASMFPKLMLVAVLLLQVTAVPGLGTFKPLEVNNDQAMVMARFSVPLIQKHIKGDKFYTIKSLDKVHKQMVSGTNYRLVMSLVETGCAEDAGVAGLKCDVAENPNVVRCRVLVYDQPWTGQRSITKRHCSVPKPIGKLWRKRGKRVWNKRRQAAKNGKKLSGKRLEAEFGAFVQTFGKKYASTAEYRRRMEVFAQNWQHAANFQKMERGTAKYGVTKFSDLTVEEWRATALGLDTSIPRPSPSQLFRQPATVPDVAELPTSWDWRHQGAVTPVKNQGQCGSCWAFSVTGNVEGQYYLKHKELLSFSEQELVDCDTDDHGCQGGLPDQAYKFIEFLGGLEQEQDYPYEARNGQCRLNRTDIKVKVTGSLDLPKNEADIQKWLYVHGPVSIGVNANPLMFYRGGIIDVWSFLCRASGIDHGVLLVGFGVHEYRLFNKTMPFWTVKNSWGSNWGEQGYFRLIRGTDECGIEDMASSSIVA